LNTRQFLKRIFTCPCEISYGRGNRAPTPCRWAIRKCS